MNLTPNLCSVISDLEYRVGSQCYNPNAYDGWQDIQGCEYRYPVTLWESYKVRGNINNSGVVDDEDFSCDAIKFMKYKFGSNHLFIGLGLIQVLEYLEERYNLDFNALEERYRSSPR